MYVRPFQPLFRSVKRNRMARNPIFLLACVGVLGFFIVRGLFFSSPDQVKRTVEQYYELEQVGDFAGSWELLHPQMQERFPKGAFIQDRAHVFMGHFGVETFEFELETPDLIKDWRMSADQQPIEKVYAVPVTQVYKGKYGVFQFSQTVYVTKVEGDWLILWDYNF